MSLLDDLVWVPDPAEGYSLAEVVDVGDGEVKARRLNDLTNATKGFSLEQVLPAHRGQDTSINHFHDNTQLIYLHAASLLRNLKLRYEANLIYTYTAHILLVVNPFQELPVYDEAHVSRYKGKSIGSEPPHIFAIADSAYRHMKNSKKSQSIIVSGESGAGKTETSKHIMKYLTSLSGGGGEKIGHLEEVILEASPILESFGNAKTIRNKNSSRFGKFIEIHFNKEGVLTGASISHYLLEKSRVCFQNSNERNYHVFYEFCAGAPEELKKELLIGGSETYRILGSCHKIDGVDDKLKFQDLVRAMDCVGMSAEEKKEIFKIIATVLHVGSLEFHEDESDTTGGCSVKDHSGPVNPVEVAARLLGIDLDIFKQTLTSRTMSAAGNKGTVLRKPLKIWEAVATRDALAKSIYARLFDWLVARINQSLPFSGSETYIGVLDIAGFEYFDVNSYEQFCINYCNEKLQGYFNEKVLKQEQLIYQQEGIHFEEIEYLTNEDCIEIIEHPKEGIFFLLDEESKMPQANDKRFTTQIHDKFKKHKKFGGPKKAPLKANQKLKDDEAFLIRHYAGAVCYQTAGFLEKNNDALNPDVEALMEASQNPFVTKLFESSGEVKATTKGKLNFVSVGETFKKQLTLLLHKLEATNSQFVRCIKPNMNQEPNFFNGVDVLQQLHVGGMLEALRLMQQGFPSRTDFVSLYNMYKDNLPPIIANLDVRTFCEALIFAMGSNENDFQFGLTKVFFKAGKYALLDEITRQDELNTKELIERVRRWLVRKRWKKFIFAAISVQKLNLKIKDRAMTRRVLQTCCRAYVGRKKFAPVIQKCRADRLQREYEEALRREREEAERLEAERRRIEELERIAREEEEKRRREEEERRLEEERRERERLEEEKRRREEEERLERERVEEEERRRIEEERRRQDEERRLQEEERKRQEEERKKREEEERLERERQMELARQDAERAAKAQAEAEAERKRQEALREAEEKRRLEREEEERLKKEEAERERLERLEAEREAAEREEREERERQEEEDRRRAQKEETERLEQEKRDHDLAVRLAREMNEDVPHTPMTPRADDKHFEVPSAAAIASSSAAGSPASLDLSKWSYAQLRDTINSSTDIEMLQACRNEFQKRLKAYYNWKTKYENKTPGAGGAPGEAPAPAPSQSNDVVKNIIKQTVSTTDVKDKEKAKKEKEKEDEKAKKKAKKKSSAKSDRYFRIPFTRPGKGGKGKKKGLWWAHFEGQKIKRQLETHPQGKPVCLVAGVNDAEMCDLSLAETGLTEKPGAEISKQTFEEEWDRCWAVVNKDVRAKKIINILEDCGF